MKIISWNLNGLLSCIKNNSFSALQHFNPDILCLQEIRTKQQTEILPGYIHLWNSSQRDGYSGTAILVKKPPITSVSGCGDADHEGRVLTIELSKCFVVNAYAPNSQKNLSRHTYRLEWDKQFRDYVVELNYEKPVIICGDFNAARDEIDVYPENERQYWAQQGYASDERSNLELLLEEGFVDAFRAMNPEVRSYTWWSNRLQKRKENRGWRLDYFFLSQELLPSITTVSHLTDIMGSDHCPILLEVKV